MTSKVGTFANMSNVAPCDAANALISDALPENKRVLISKLCDAGVGGGGGDDGDGDGCDGDVPKVFPTYSFTRTWLLGSELVAREGKDCQLASFAAVL